MVSKKRKVYVKRETTAGEEDVVEAPVIVPEVIPEIIEAVELKTVTTAETETDKTAGTTTTEQVADTREKPADKSAADKAGARKPLPEKKKTGREKEREQRVDRAEEGKQRVNKARLLEEADENEARHRRYKPKNRGGLKRKEEINPHAFAKPVEPQVYNV